MAKLKKVRRNRKKCFIQYVPEELIQYIQSLLPVKEAVRISTLSKSWERAWSTNPTLRFHPHYELEEARYIHLIDGTLRRYHRNQIPILRFDLELEVHDETTVSLTNEWVGSLVSLKELNLKLSVGGDISSYTLPGAIFSFEKLDSLSVKLDCGHVISRSSLLTSHIRIPNNAVFKWVHLREIDFLWVHMTQDMLHDLFSTCILLEKVTLAFHNKYKKLEVKSLRFLRELKITPYRGRGTLDMRDLPSLTFFSFNSSLILSRKRLWNYKDMSESLKELVLEGAVIDKAFCGIFNAHFPSLRKLSLDIQRSKLKNVAFDCVSLERFVINLQNNTKISIRVIAPKLRFFRFTGKKTPHLSFRPHKIVLKQKRNGNGVEIISSTD